MGSKNSSSVKIGDTNYNKYGTLMEVIEYRGYDDITVKFENGITQHTNSDSFKKGQVHSYLDKTICGKGYIGKNFAEPIKDKLSYKYWSSMIRRCYNSNLRNKRYYSDVEVCDEWLNYSKFKKWFDKNYWKCDETLDIDKDILFKGNKIYSPQTCLLVPHKINVLFCKANKIRGKYPLGVSYTINKQGIKYIYAQTFEKQKRKYAYVGKETQDVILRAFNVYKESKENHLKYIADLYKSKYPSFPQKLYDALYNYQVEITD